MFKKAHFCSKVRFSPKGESAWDGKAGLGMQCGEDATDDQSARVLFLDIETLTFRGQKTYLSALACDGVATFHSAKSYLRTSSSTGKALTQRRQRACLKCRTLQDTPRTPGASTAELRVFLRVESPPAGLVSVVLAVGEIRCVKAGRRNARTYLAWTCPCPTLPPACLWQAAPSSCIALPLCNMPHADHGGPLLP